MGTKKKKVIKKKKKESNTPQSRPPQWTYFPFCTCSKCLKTIYKQDHHLGTDSACRKFYQIATLEDKIITKKSYKHQ